VDDPNTKKSFLLRLPKPLLDEMRSWAAQDMRSLNGQIEWLLRDALRKHSRPDHDDPPQPNKPLD
jgi:hypothetical protein